ncbi:MAG: FAD-dependent oxidoreductase [Armatimonadetes bacterium]|nr:FAD-dependent oxidoreductase [Armatimonadota bacterium]
MVTLPTWTRCLSGRSLAGGRAVRALAGAILLLVPAAARAVEPLLAPVTLAEDALEMPPSGWEAQGGTAPWVVRETGESGLTARGIAATAVQEGASYLTRTFPAARAPYALRFRARAQSDAARRGLSWGLSQGDPTAQAARAFHLALGPKGQLSSFNGVAWQGLAPVEAGRWYVIETRVFPTSGAFDVLLDGWRLNDEPIPFWNGVTPDTLFFNNYAAGPEGAEILFTEVAITPLGIPAAPAGLRIIRLAPDALDLDWLTPEVPVSGYRLYRNGEPLRDLPGDATRFADSGLEPSKLYIYRLAALGEGDPVPRSRLSRPAADYTLPPATANAPKGNDYDVLVVGATPGGIAAALAAARTGARVALTEHSPWIGGMMAGGLSNTDFKYKETHGGTFREFTSQVLDFYKSVYGPESRQAQVSIGGYKFEPRVARAVLRRMLAAEPNISLFLPLRATGVKKEGRRVAAVTFADPVGGGTRTLTARFTIDATYEGDVAALAGAEYRIGRESRDDYDEQHAGELFWNMDEKDLKKRIVWEKSSGKGDRRVQAYNYRLCLTSRPDNLVLIPEPEGYDRSHYLKIIADARSGYANWKRVMGYQGLLPNDKWDVNNSASYWPSTDFIGANYDYPEADWQRREAITRAHRSYIQGLLYFLQNDPELPEEFRAEARRWGLARDEFVDNENWPTQIYVRESRRFVGEYWFTENDTRPRAGEGRSPLQKEGVAVGDYSLDSHATQPPKPDAPHLVEGFFYGGHTEPYQVPFGVMVPKGVEGLLVPVAVSATHIGLSTVRMEPTWMALGQAAGTAAFICQRLGLPIRRLPIRMVQDATLLAHQVTIFLRGVEYGDRDLPGLNYAGLIGLLPTYDVEARKPMDRGTAAQWLWHWMRVRWPELREPRRAPQFADVAADSPLYPAARVIGAIEAMGKVASGAAFHPDEPIAAADAARWIARAHRVSSRWHRTASQAFRADLETRLVALLEGVAAGDSDVDPKALTRGQFARLLYLAARVATPLK